MRIVKIFALGIFYILIIFLFVCVHEFAHCFMCEFTGGKCLEINIFGGKYSSNPHVLVISKSGIGRQLTIIAGSLFAGIIAASMREYALMKDKMHLYLSTSICLMNELLYWSISPLIGQGDAWMLLMNTNINNLLFCIPLFIALGITLAKTIYRIGKMVEDRYI